MTGRELAAEYRLRKWAGLIQEFNDSGLSVKAFCESIGIHENTFYYRRNKLRDMACTELAKELVPGEQKPVVWAGINTGDLAASGDAADTGGVRISRDGWTVTVEPGFDGGHLTEVLRAVSRSCC